MYTVSLVNYVVGSKEWKEFYVSKKCVVLCHTNCTDICWSFTKYTAYILGITEVKIVEPITEAFITNIWLHKMLSFNNSSYIYIYKQYQKA